jgi:hypothetical protein
VSFEANQKYDLSIYDLMGKLVIEIKNATTPTIDISSLKRGIYMVKFIADGKKSVQKLVVL